MDWLNYVKDLLELRYLAIVLVINRWWILIDLHAIYSMNIKFHVGYHEIGQAKYLTS